MAPPDQAVTISCLCGRARQAVRPLPRPDGSPPAFCHCDDCRHVTGLLCTSYLPVEPPASLDGLAAYAPSPGTARYFCGTCGCHVFLLSRGGEAAGGGGGEAWQVATGVLADSPDGDEPGGGGGGGGAPGPLRHDHVSSTKDGGLSVWLPGGPGRGGCSSPGPAGTGAGDDGGGGDDDDDDGPAPPGAVPASCHCGSVRFRITRPSTQSALPRSPYSDLIVPFHTGSPRVANPEDAKWWLRRGGTRYLAGTCACRSCRLASGFDVQAWAFVPRANILLPAGGGGWRPLDFGRPPAGGGGGADGLRRYDSSPGVMREFCARCGATAFWHDTGRPDLVDVSVGLLRAGGGARAEECLDWCTGRVSFVEDAGLGQTGWARARAKALASALEAGLRGWAGGGGAE